MTLVHFTFVHASFFCQVITGDDEAQSINVALRKGGYLVSPELTGAILELRKHNVTFEFIETDLPNDFPFPRVLRPVIDYEIDKFQQFIASSTTIQLPALYDDLGPIEAPDVFHWLNRVLLIFERQMEGTIFNDEALEFYSSVILKGFVQGSKPHDPTLAWLAREFSHSKLQSIVFIAHENHLLQMRLSPQIQYLASPNKDRFLFRIFYFNDPHLWHDLPYIIDNLNSPQYGPVDAEDELPLRESSSYIIN